MQLRDVRALAAGIEQLTFWLRRATPQIASSSTITALHRLAGEGPQRVSELAAKESISQPGVTMLVNRLSAAGYVERVPDPTDGRATLVRITPPGRALLNDWHARRSQAVRDRFAELDPGDQALLLAALPAIERLVASVPTAVLATKARS